jgi:hypothetical protein
VSIEYAAIVVGVFLVVGLLIWRLHSIEIRLHAIEMRSGKMRKGINALLAAKSRGLLMALNSKPNVDGSEGEPNDVPTAPNSNGDEGSNELDTERFALVPAKQAVRMPTLDETKRLLSRIEADLGS